MKDENKKRHLKTIRKHIRVVRKTCFKMGIPLQGLLHDRSKFSKVEMSIAKWANGTRSPHDNARDELGYSPAWYHHKALNKHHWEHWTDYNAAVQINGELYLKAVGVKIPYKYVIEMVCDFIGAGKAYSPKTWTTKMPLDYWLKSCKGKRIMHADSEELFETLLYKLASFEKEKDFFKWYKKSKKFLKYYYEHGYSDDSSSGFKEIIV